MLAKIIGTGSYVPANCVDNQAIAEKAGTTDEWIRERTGVVRRHFIEEDTTASMAAEAGRRALSNAQIAPEEVELVIVCTCSTEMRIPCTACAVQEQIGLPNATCYDLNAACTGFLYAFQAAQAYVAAGMYRTVLLIGSESLSNILDWTDRNTCILFGDGAGAIVLQAHEGTGYPCITHSDGTFGKVLTLSSRHRKDYVPGNDPASLLYMDGRAVLKFAVHMVPKVIQEALEAAKISAEEIDYFILHQANQRIVESIAKRLNQPMEKFPVNIQEYGNTSSASIPLLLDEMNRKGDLKEGQKLILAGFGGGLTWGAVLIEW